MDSSDEPVYNYLKSVSCDEQFSKNSEKYICVLGKQPSSANYYIDGLEDIKVLINRLKNVAQKRKKIRSFGDLQNSSPLIIKTGSLKKEDRSNFNVSILMK